MGILLELMLSYLLFLGSPTRSARIYSLLKSLPENFVLSFEVESTQRVLMMLERRNETWRILRRNSQYPEEATWTLRFRSPSVLRQILFLEIPLQNAFVERKMSFKGSIADTLKILKLFETLVVYTLPWERWSSRLSREVAPASRTKALFTSFQFALQAPFQLWHNEREIR